MEKFWSKVTKTSTCWLWTGAATGRGYGSWRAPNGRDYGAHRLAYETLVGPIPDGLTVDHLCRNKACVNPAHMELVTVRENILRSKARTHCPQGHEYTPENNLRAKTGGFKCRTCHNANRRKVHPIAVP